MPGNVWVRTLQVRIETVKIVRPLFSVSGRPGDKILKDCF